VSVVGIDLGTTNTVVGCVRTGKVHVLADEKGVRLLPSVVSFHPNGEVLVGAAAKARRIIDAKNTIYSHKRLIGRSWNSPEIVQARQRFAFELREGPGQGPLVHARGQDYTLPEISAFVLKRARQIAEAALGTPVERAVITVPAHFNELQRASTKVAGRISGLEVLRILNEPTAAALAYGLGRTGNERVAVYDFGGGTFDCTLLDLNGNVFEVLATAGDSFLGGDDIDNLIADRMAEVLLRQHRVDARQDPQIYERLKTTAEEVKIALSTAETHTAVIKDIAHGTGGSSLSFNFTLSRKDLDAMITPIVDRTFKVTQDALSLARLSPTSFDKVILVGGSTRVPLVRKRVEAFFGSPPMDRVNPDEVVAIGAAIQAAALTEGIRRRSIPAPPGVRRSQADTQEHTQTSELDPAMLKPAFGSAPPNFGFGSIVGSTPPDKFAFASSAGSTPPNNPIQMPPNASVGPGIAGAQATPTGRKQTHHGIAPAPTGGQPPTQASAEDPSMASFPDLSLPSPFEWVSPAKPGDGPPARGAEAKRQSSAPGIAAPAATQRQPSSPAFGTLEEPPSLFSTPSGSLPSFPSMTNEPKMPSPAGDAPWREAGGVQKRPGSLADGAFGAVSDLSLVSTTGVTSPAAPPDDGGGFGHVSDLSLISSDAASAAADALQSARAKGGIKGKIDDDTEAVLHKKGESPKEKHDHDSIIDRTDLPATIPRAKPARKPGQVGMGKTGSPLMMGKAPPPVAPQPFGPMERIEDPPASARTGAQARAPGKAPPGGKPGTGAPATQRHPSPGGESKPSPPQKPPPPPKRAATTEAFGSPQPPPAPAPAPAAPAQPPPVPNLASTMPAIGAPNAAVPAPAPAFAAPAAAPSAPPGYAGPYTPSAPPLASPFSSPPPQAPIPGPQPFSAPPPQAPVAGPQPFSAPPPQARVAGPQPFSAPPPQAPIAGPRPVSAPPPRAPSAPPPQAPSAPPQPFSFGSGPPTSYAPPAQPGFGSVAPNAGMASQPPIFGAFSSASSAPPPDPSQPLDFPLNAFDANPNIPRAPAAPQALTYQAPVLVDVTPRALVVETAGGYTDTIIPRNSKIPCERTRRFATGRDMQTTVRVRVAQGESALFPQNTYLGEVELSGLRPAARGEVTVAVTFEVDADGTLRVRARDVQTGQEARATLQLVGVADESSVVMMINRFAQQPVVGGPTQ
jgi:molecular chaperone DnaK